MINHPWAHYVLWLIWFSLQFFCFLRTNACCSYGEVLMNMHLHELLLNGSDRTICTASCVDICCIFTNDFPRATIVSIISEFVFLFSSLIFLNVFVSVLSCFVMYELQYDATAYEFSTNWELVFVSHISGIWWAKLFVQVSDGFL